MASAASYSYDQHQQVPSNDATPESSKPKSWFWLVCAVILLVFAQLPTQRARHVRYLRFPDQIRDSARSLLRQGA